MRVLAYLKKTFLENLREWKILILSLFFAPAFVYLMYGYFSAAAPAYRLLVLNHDVEVSGSGDSSGEPTTEVKGLIEAWKGATHPDGKPIFEIIMTEDLEAAQTDVRNRDADLLVEIPEGFTNTLTTFRETRSGMPALLINYSDEKNMRGSMAMTLSDYVAFYYAAETTDAPMPMTVSIKALNTSGPISEFDLYVPALLVLAIIMILFTAATSLVKEVDKGTMTRLMLSKLGTSELLTAVAINQVFLGLVALTLAYLAAMSCGYESNGSFFAIIVVGAVATLGVVALSVIVSAFLKSMFELLTVGTFPFFVLMFFSECMFPLPKIRMFELGVHTVYANDVLPTTLCVRAFNKILNFGGGIGDVGFEIVAMLLLTTVYFAVGAWLFQKRHQQI